MATLLSVEAVEDYGGDEQVSAQVRGWVLERAIVNVQRSNCW